MVFCWEFPTSLGLLRLKSHGDPMEIPSARPVDENGMTPPPHSHHVADLTVRLRSVCAGFFSNRDQVFFSMERNGDFMGFRGNSVKFIKDNETGDARICHLSFHIFPSIQWGNNPSCWIKNKFFHLTPKLKGSRSTVSSVSDRKKQFGQTGSPKPLKQLVCLKHATVQGTCSEHDDKPRPPV